MGCCASKQAAEFASIENEAKKNGSVMTKAELSRSTDPKTPRKGSGTAADAQAASNDAQFDNWSSMEEAEEKAFLADEEDTKDIDAALKKEFPEIARQRSQMSEVNTWEAKLADVKAEPSDFEIRPPFTMEKASAFYKHLCMPDNRRRNPERADDAPCISRRSIYEVMVAAFRMYDERAKREGALQMVPAPTSKAEKLRVCGDTHGQLADVLWIFDEHGEPSANNAYLFNGDVADRGKHAVEIFLLLLCYQLADPKCMYINRGNHEQRDLNERPFSAGGGFCWELRGKYPHDENLVDLFHRFFNTMPIAALVGQWALVIHGGLFREPGVTLDDIRKVDFRRNPPQALESTDDNMLFDSLWADPHAGNGVIVGSQRGAFSATFGADVTKDFCARNGIKSVVRSHQLPKKQRGFEILHDAMLLTIFSASNYGGACRNKGGVLIFDEQGPAEVKEFYAPELDQLRAMYEFRAVQKLKSQISGWRAAAMAGKDDREVRREERNRRGHADVQWKHLILKVDELGQLDAEDDEMVKELPKRWSSNDELDDDRDEAGADKPGEYSDRLSAAGGGSGKTTGDQAAVKSIRRRTLVDHLLRPDLVKLQAAAAAAAGNPDRKSARAAAMEAGMPEGDKLSGVVFVEEEEQSRVTEQDIFYSMLDELCKNKVNLGAAFAAAEAKEKGEEGGGKTAGQSGKEDRMSLKRRTSGLSSRTVSYDSWLGVLSAELPEYGELWQVYGPKLLGSAKVPQHAEPPRCRVSYVGWLNRFHVKLAYETYDSFSHSMLERLYNRLLARTKTMPMAELFAYFDPNHDGTTQPQELVKALRALELGLSTPQLEALAVNLGFKDGSEEVEPMLAITLLLECIGPSIRGELRKKKKHTMLRPGGRSASFVLDADTNPNLNDLGNSGGLLQVAEHVEVDEATAEAYEAKLHRLGALLRANMAKTTKTMGASAKINAIFADADADGNGVLSRKEATTLLMELQGAVSSDGEGEVVVKDEAECEALVSHVDIDGNGCISFVEFLVAFGLSDGKEVVDERISLAQDIAASVVADTTPDIIQGVCRNICAALYERAHGLARAFAYLDVAGDGWLSVPDFEQAILLVMRHVAPRVKRADPKKSSSSDKNIGLDGEGLVVDASCVASLVASLEGSSLTDGKSPPQIDCYAFIQAFEVCDSEGVLS